MARERGIPLIFFEEGVTTEIYPDGRVQEFREYTDPANPRQRIVHFYVDTVTGKGSRKVTFKQI